MKKLEKLGLKEMKSEMSLLLEGAQEKLVGGYTNDCFWQCVSYMETGDPSTAGYYANNYFNDGRQDLGINYKDYGSVYANMGGSYAPDFTDGKEIVSFNTADGVGNYENTGTWHAVVITGDYGSDGGHTYYDPQLGTYGHFTASDMEKTVYSGY